jgi:hypothetical protein
LRPQVDADITRKMAAQVVSQRRVASMPGTPGGSTLGNRT